MYRTEDTKMDLARELLSYMSNRKKYWLLPILVMTTIFGTLVVLTQGTAVAPFIYTLF
ncbi:hypothetical protein N182_10595 [Sinorhizobium sp. GL2]|nr:hypothetical protein N182_10595 [Sinorhizobium sp. GL2]